MTADTTNRAYFVDLDGYGDETLWRRRDGGDPDPVASRPELDRINPDLWPAVVTHFAPDSVSIPDEVLGWMAKRAREHADERKALHDQMSRLTQELDEALRQRDALHPSEGRVVVELPEPDAAGCWWVANRRIAADNDLPDCPAVWLDELDLWSADARRLGASLIAAADRADQVAAESAAQREVSDG